MKRLLLILLLPCMLTGRTQVSTLDMVLHYKMYDGWQTYKTGVTKKVFDYSLANPFPYDGVVAAGVTATFPGYLFDTSEIDASRGVTDNVWDGGGTLSVWLRPKGRGETGDGRVADKTDDEKYGWRLNCDDDDDNLYFVLIADVCDGCWKFPFDILSDKWWHLTFTYNSDDRLNDPVVYVDGRPVAVTNVRRWTTKYDRSTDITCYLIIGDRDASDRAWDGSMDDFRLYTRAVGSAEALSFYEHTRRYYQK